MGEAEVVEEGECEVRGRVGFVGRAALATPPPGGGARKCRGRPPYGRPTRQPPPEDGDGATCRCGPGPQP